MMLYKKKVLPLPIVNGLKVMASAFRAPLVTTSLRLAEPPSFPIESPPPMTWQVLPTDLVPNTEGGQRTSAAPRPNAGSPQRRGIEVEVSSNFKLVFLTIVALTLICGITHVLLAAVWESPTPNQQSAFDAMGFAWKAGVGAILGLIGGKIT